MGIANFRRDRKKTVAIVASLSLGGIILLVVSSIVLLRSPAVSYTHLDVYKRQHLGFTIPLSNMEVIQL